MQRITAGFWIDLIPVTNAQYAAFVKDAGYQKEEYWTTGGWAWRQYENATGPLDFEGYTDPEQPRVGISWHEASAYAKWRGCRLPSELEWEWAARGPENRIYPWGDDFIDDVNVVIWYGNSDGVSAKVGNNIRVRGASWVGALDMVGNVSQWMRNEYQIYPYTSVGEDEFYDTGTNKIVIRGGCWRCSAHGPAYVRGIYRDYGKPIDRSNNVGVRCVYR
jgi:formylglycine-generating enzyme required for sulfatase activity